MTELVRGAVAFGFLIVGLYFLRFWRETHDRLFMLFALSFLVMAVSRVAIAFSDEQELFYLLRLIAFGMILLAIIDKNRSASGGAA